MLVGKIAFILMLLFFYAIPPGGIYLPLILGKKKVQLKWGDIALLIMPFALWCGLITYHGAGKTLGNAVMEPFLCGFTSGIPLVLKIMEKKNEWLEKVTPYLGLVLSCVIVFIIYQFLPSLPE